MDTIGDLRVYHGCIIYGLDMLVAVLDGDRSPTGWACVVVGSSFAAWETAGVV